MKIKIFPRDLLEAKWKLDLEQFNDSTTPVPTCLRCGQSLDRDLFHNKLSRYLPVTICCACGDDEAFRSYAGKMLPFEQWHAVISGLIRPDAEPQTAYLMPVCSFTHIFEKTKDMSHSGANQPVSLVVYSRSDHNGYRWYTSWFDGPAGHPSNELVKEIDDIQNTLFALPEMESLGTMDRLRYFAEPTDDSTEYNLYSETAHFYIWLRLIFRQRDYNLRVYYYRK